MKSQFQLLVELARSSDHLCELAEDRYRHQAGGAEPSIHPNLILLGKRLALQRQSHLLVKLRHLSHHQAL